MAIICYHASHEQFSPGELLGWMKLVEAAGFDAVHSSDHFYPWGERQGQSGFSFAWLGAAMQAIRLPFGVICAPGGRYHPAVIAQAAATLAEMFPDRFWLELGSGEALNEHITGEPWPEKSVRNKRLYESAHIIKRLLNGETVTHEGAVTIKDAKLYTRPPKVPPIIAAAVTDHTAEWLGSWAEGLITIHKPLDKMKATVDAFHKGGGKGKPLYLKMQLSYARSYDEALAGALDQWRTNVLPSEKLQDLYLPQHFDAAAREITAKEIEQMVLVSDDPAKHVAWIKQYIELGFEHIILHNVNRQQEFFIKDFGEHVLPHL
ncbi:TIGR03885 family FMN-dependent LLM class oxidoreductase [Longitalea luteola]|uniref:TIGR03885 family FMN-dependent LLM class oxidoreductase n=1 Tax=Longitalea luteola TaxID=2812563 RepID=UPI001A97A833|nr:TIGR03885 family FMN-dependent LLM class oxidoreductase [Longitalea luteola]